MTQPDPLIVHADGTEVLETFDPHSEEARVGIAAFAELECGPEHLHTYRITPLSLWRLMNVITRSGLPDLNRLAARS